MALAFAEKTLTKALEVDDGELLGELAGVLMHPGARKDKSLVTLAVKAAESSSQLAGNNDRFALMKLAEAYYAAGDKTKGKQIGQRAVDATIDERQKESFRRALEYLDKYN